MALQIEVAHEALIQNWRRLGDWLNQDREYLLWRQTLRSAVELWKENKNDRDTLLRGTLLQTASDWESKRGKDLGPDEKAYITESRNLETLLEREKIRRQRWNRIWYGAVALLVITCVGIWWMSSKSTKKTITASGYLGQASLYEQRGDYNSAIDAYDKALILSPELPFAYLGRAKVYYRLGGEANYRNAIADYTDFINLVRDVIPAHDLALAYDGRGQAYMQLNDFDNARKDFTTAIERDSHSAQALYDLGLLFVRQGKPDEAIKWYTQSIASDANFYSAYLSRGKALFLRYKTSNRAEDLNSALADFYQAHYLKGDAAEPYLNIGLVYNERGDSKKAVESYEEALKHNNNYGEAYNALGEAYVQLHQLEKAITNFNDAAQRGYIRAYYNLGLAYKDKDEFENAIKSLQTFIDNAPDNGEAFLPLGEAYALKGDQQAAIQNYSKSLELKPEQSDAYFGRGESYLKTGDKEKAKNDLLAFIKSTTNQKTPTTQPRLSKARQHLEQLDFEPPIDFVQIHLHFDKSIDEAFLERVKTALRDKRFNRISSTPAEAPQASIKYFQAPFKKRAEEVHDIVKGVYGPNDSPNFKPHKFPDPMKKDAYGWIEVWLPASHAAAPAPSPNP
jgi:tetratricopeptide (TPR) repeat protein